MRVIKSQIPQYQPLDGMSTDVVREFRGVNTYDPLSIDDAYLTDAANVTTDDYPAASTRPGYTLMGLPFGTRVTGLGIFQDRRLVAAFNDGSWRIWTLSNTWSAPILTFTASDMNAQWTFTNFQGNWSEVNLVGTNGLSGTYRFNGVTTTLISGAPSNANFITTYSNRLWCAVGKELHASALDQGDVWNLFAGTGEDSFVKDVESTRGANINSLSAGLQKLTIGMANAIVELYGSLPSDFYTVQVTEDEGTINNRSTFSQDGVIRFIHPTGIYEYSGGVLPDKKFSEMVKGFLTSITSASVAGSDGRRLYFTIATNTTLVFDPVLQTWTIWKGFTPTCYAVLDNVLYVGDATGRVLKIGGTTDNGTAISSYIISKPFTSSAVAQRQRWLKLFVFYEMAAGATLNVYLSQALSGDADWTLVKTITGDGTPGVQRAMVPVDKIALAHYVRVKFEWTGWVKLHEYTRSQRLLPIY